MFPFFESMFAKLWEADHRSALILAQNLGSILDELGLSEHDVQSSQYLRLMLDAIS